ncbi:MAG TPA: DNA repair protein RecO [Verrucomicrobiae bacterium]|nr:DNA repair protein RecO [Verrucomicrobiae bacterium]
MAIESAIGIILLTRPLTETSLIVHWLTPNFGRIATVAKGARRPKSPFLGKLDLFYEAAFSFTRSRRSELHVLREVSIRAMHVELRADLPKLRHAAYAAAFIRQVTETETPLPAIFTLFRDFLKELCGQKTSLQIVFSFELKLLRELGLEPHWPKTHLTAGTKKIAALLLERGFVAGENLRLTNAQTNELGRFLRGFLIFHLGHLPTGRSAALEIAN